MGNSYLYKEGRKKAREACAREKKRIERRNTAGDLNEVFYNSCLRRARSKSFNCKIRDREVGDEGNKKRIKVG